MLAEMILQELFRDFGFHINFFLFLSAGTAYIQAAPIFFDMLTDALQHRAASKAADMKGIWGGIAVPDAEPEVVRNHLLKPHFALRLDCSLIGYGDHRHLLRTLGVAVDEWVVLDFRHGLHRLSVCIQEPALAVGQCFCLCAEEYGGESILHFPDVQVLVARYHNGCAILVLEGQAALVVILGKFLGTVAVDVRHHPIEKSVFHGILLLSLILGVGYGYNAIIGIASLQLALGQQRAILTKVDKIFLTLSTRHEKSIWSPVFAIFCCPHLHWRNVNPDSKTAPQDRSCEAVGFVIMFCFRSVWVDLAEVIYQKTLYGEK